MDDWYEYNALFFGQFLSPLITHFFVQYFGVQHFFIVMGIFVMSTLSIFIQLL